MKLASSSYLLYGSCKGELLAQAREGEQAARMSSASYVSDFARRVKWLCGVRASCGCLGVRTEGVHAWGLTKDMNAWELSSQHWCREF